MAQEEIPYFLYDKENQRLDHRVQIILSIKAAEDNQNRDFLNIAYDWQVVVDGRTVTQDQLLIRNRRSDPDAQSKIKVIYEDPFHYYYLKYYTQGDAAEAEIGAAYIEYKD